MKRYSSHTPLVIPIRNKSRTNRQKPYLRDMTLPFSSSGVGKTKTRTLVWVPVFRTYSASAPFSICLITK